MAHISEADYKILRQLREFGVLQNVKPELISQNEGICLILCADGDRFDNIYCFHKELMRQYRSHPRIHVLAGHGGALVLPPGSPLNVNKRSENLLKDIRDVITIKGIRTFALHTHTPCGAAELVKLPIVEQIMLHKEADAIVQNQIPGIQALCFLQIYWEGKERIYFISGEKWREYLKITQSQRVA